MTHSTTEQPEPGCGRRQSAIAAAAAGAQRRGSTRHSPQHPKHGQVRRGRPTLDCGQPRGRDECQRMVRRRARAAGLWVLPPVRAPLPTAWAGPPKLGRHWSSKDCLVWSRRRLGELFASATLLDSPRVVTTGCAAGAPQRAPRAPAHGLLWWPRSMCRLRHAPKLDFAPSFPSVVPSSRQARVPGGRGLPEQSQGQADCLVRAQGGGWVEGHDGGRARGQRHHRAAGACGGAHGRGCLEPCVLTQTAAAHTPATLDQRKQWPGHAVPAWPARLNLQTPNPEASSAQPQNGQSCPVRGRRE